MRGKILFLALVIWASFSCAGKADNNNSLIIVVQDSSLSINGSTVSISDVKQATIDYLREYQKINNSHPSPVSDNIPQVIIRLNNMKDSIYLSQIVKQIELTFHDCKNQTAIRYFQKYYETLNLNEQTKIDSICNFQIKKIIDKEMVTIIPQLNY